jgi:P-type conjugative transfer protein TrbJ
VKTFKVVVVGAVLAMTAALCWAGGAVAGATEPTQIMNNIQLMASYMEHTQQTVTQLNQYQAMLKNLERMTPSNLLDAQARRLWQDQNMTQTFMGLRRVVVGGETISYSLSNIDGQFKRLHPGYKGYGDGFNYTQAYSNWSDNTLSSVRNAMALTTAHEEDFVTEEDMMNELQTKSQTASGQLESLQAGQQISMAMVGQLQKLRQLQMAQMGAQNAYIAGEQSRRDSAAASLESIAKQAPVSKSIR